MAAASKPSVHTYGSLWARNRKNNKQSRVGEVIRHRRPLRRLDAGLHRSGQALQTDRPPPTEQESRPVRDLRPPARLHFKSRWQLLAFPCKDWSLFLRFAGPSTVDRLRFDFNSAPRALSETEHDIRAMLLERLDE